MIATAVAILKTVEAGTANEKGHANFKQDINVPVKHASELTRCCRVEMRWGTNGNLRVTDTLLCCKITALLVAPCKACGNKCITSSMNIQITDQALQSAKKLNTQSTKIGSLRATMRNQGTNRGL